MDTRANVKKVSIIGAGPVGLALTLALLEETKNTPNKEYEIDIIEKRDLDFKRGQKIIVLDDPTSLRGVRWDTFCIRTFFPNNKLTLDKNNNLLVDDKIPEKKDRRYKFVEKLLRQPRNTGFPINFSIKQLQAALLEHITNSQVKNVKINWHTNSHVETVDLQAKELKLSPTQDKINFDILVDCEGEKRETVAEINRALKTFNPTNPIQFTFDKMGNKPTYHMAIKMKIKPPTSGSYQDFLEAERKRYQTDPAIQRGLKAVLQAHVNVEDEDVEILDLPFLFDPNIYKENLGVENWVPKFFVAGSIPQEIHNITDENEKRKLLIHWASYLLAEQFKIAPENFIFDSTNDEENDKRRALTFTLLHQFVNRPMYKLENGLILVLAGDAALSPDYWRGISSTIGLNEILILAKSIRQGSYLSFNNAYDIYLKLIQEHVKKPIYSHNAFQTSTTTTTPVNTNVKAPQTSAQTSKKNVH